MTIADNIQQLKQEIGTQATLVAVSKTKPVSDLIEAYSAGQRDFGENYVQELCEKQPLLAQDITWHFIGHLQSNKVKYIAPFITWIHGVESGKLLSEINKQAGKHNRHIKCLLQIHIATEESKFGFDIDEAMDYCQNTNFADYPNVKLCGLMGMASFTEDHEQVRTEFKKLKTLFDHLKEKVFQHAEDFKEISMGMSGDWKLAIEEGSTMVRIGSAIFGNRK